VRSDPEDVLATLRSALAHELGQPLAVARGYLELLELRGDEATRQLAPARIREAIERAVLLSLHLARLLELELGADVEEGPGAEALVAARDHVTGLAGSRAVQIEEDGVPPATDGVALGLLLAAAVERAERGSTVTVVAGEAGGVVLRWEGDAFPAAVTARVEQPGWAGDTASLAPHVARRRLAVAGRGLRVGEHELAITPAT
jgi:signal transduction histidine kinase